MRNALGRLGVWLWLVGCASWSLAADELLIADFEGETYGDWKATGEAFGPGPARGTLPGQMEVSGFEGKGRRHHRYAHVTTAEDRAQVH
jgi:hypothetical protein